MADQEEDSLPGHLRALLEGNQGALRGEVEKAIGRSMEKLSTGRLGRAFKLGALAASGGARMALGRAKQALGSSEGGLSGSDGLAIATQMLTTFSELRGVAMKLGQMLSYVDDGLPPEVRKLLAVLQRDAPPMPWETVRTVLTEELGRDPDTVFRDFEQKPLAAASIGQVHRATLLNGTRVAVKVQYPGIEKAMRSDLKNGQVAAIFNRLLFVHTDVKSIMSELEERLLDECDYRKEAAYQREFGQRFAGHPTIVVPEVHLDTARLLVTTLQPGRSFYEWLGSSPDAAARERAVRTFYRFYLGSFYLDGLFNCDPHPGNYLFQDDGRIVFLDYGCCRRFPDERRRAWINVALAVRADVDAEIERAGREIQFIPPEIQEYDHAAFRDLMRHLYAPYLVDEPYDFALHRPGKTFRSMFTDNPNLFRMNMPADAVFLNRITFGLVSLMTEMGSPLNCYRLANEYFLGRDPDWPAGSAAARVG